MGRIRRAPGADDDGDSEPGDPADHPPLPGGRGDAARLPALHRIERESTPPRHGDIHHRGKQQEDSDDEQASLHVAAGRNGSSSPHSLHTAVDATLAIGADNQESLSTRPEVAHVFGHLPSDGIVFEDLLGRGEYFLFVEDY